MTMNRRRFIYSGTVGLASLTSATGADSPAKEVTAVLLRQQVPESGRFFYAQFLRDAAPRSIMGRLLDLKPEFINPRFGMLGTAADAATESAEGGGLVFRPKDFNAFQPGRKLFGVDGFMAGHFGGMTMTIDSKVFSRKITYQKNNCRVWSKGGENEAEVSHYVLADQPFHWNWALFLVENGRVNVHFAEKLRVVDEAEGVLQFSGSVMTFGFEGVQIVDLAQVELPKECGLMDFDDKHNVSRGQMCDREKIMAEIQKSAR
jgi:hypothetical protein